MYNVKIPFLSKPFSNCIFFASIMLAILNFWRENKCFLNSLHSYLVEDKKRVFFKECNVLSSKGGALESLKMPSRDKSHFPGIRLRSFNPTAKKAVEEGLFWLRCSYYLRLSVLPLFTSLLVSVSIIKFRSSQCGITNLQFIEDM